MTTAAPIRLILHLAFDSRGRRLHGKFVTLLGMRQLCVSRQPLLDGARILLAEGVDPKMTVVTRHTGDDFDAMISTVGEASKWTVEEGEKIGPRFAPWKPFPVVRYRSPRRQNEKPVPGVPEMSQPTAQPPAAGMADRGSP